MLQLEITDLLLFWFVKMKKVAHKPNKLSRANLEHIVLVVVFKKYIYI